MNYLRIQTQSFLVYSAFLISHSSFFRDIQIPNLLLHIRISHNVQPDFVEAGLYIRHINGYEDLVVN